MNWDYETKLKSYIAQAQSDSGMTDYLFEVCNEQIFVKKKTLDPNTIYVVVKYLSSTNTLNAVTQPIQILVSCEQNQIQVSQIVFSKLVESHNFEAFIDNGSYIKQDYRQPVVLSNFNEVSYGYRTLMYISATLFIMENVMDIEGFSIRIADMFEDLSTQELSDKLIYLQEGPIGRVIGQDSPVYVLSARYLETAQITNTCGFHCYFTSDSLSDEYGLVVNGIECAYIIFDDEYLVLADSGEGELEKLYYTNYDYFKIQVLKKPSNYDNVVADIDGYEMVYYDILDEITQKVVYNETIDSVTPISFQLAYSMTPNTQPIPPQRIATSVKSVSTFSITFGIPLTSEYSFVEIINKIAAGQISGNISFYISFNIGSVEFSDLPMKLVSSQITTAINEVPGLQIGLIK